MVDGEGAGEVAVVVVGGGGNDGEGDLETDVGEVLGELEEWVNVALSMT